MKTSADQLLAGPFPQQLFIGCQLCAWPPQHVSGQEWKQSLSSGTDMEPVPGECRPDKQHKDDIRGMSQRRVKLTLESGGESAEALPGWPLGRRCLCTSVCQVQWGNRSQATEWGELAHAFPANQHRLCSLHAPPTTPCPAHRLRRSCRGPAPDLLPALWLQTHPLQTQAGICCQPVSAREA